VSILLALFIITIQVFVLLLIIIILVAFVNNGVVPTRTGVPLEHSFDFLQ
jgi:hypothetical protein